MLDQSLITLKGVGTKTADKFAKLNINTIGDLLKYYPRQNAYLDYSKLKTIAQLTVGMREIFTATIFSIQKKMSRHKTSFTVVVVKDDTGYIEFFLFDGQQYKIRQVSVGDTLIITGKVENNKIRRILTSPDFQIVDPDDQEKTTLGILPTYGLSNSLSQKKVGEVVKKSLQFVGESIEDYLPQKIIDEHNLLPLSIAIKNIHFPQNFNMLKQAQLRIKFDEFFLLTWYLSNRQNKEQQGFVHKVAKKKIDDFIKTLPYELTSDQALAWQEIALDMQDSRPMFRLLQGDVGSGKTVIAVLSLLLTVQNGWQGAIMVPTEILASQHYETLKTLLLTMNINIALLTGSIKASDKKIIAEQLQSGAIDIVVGTHALIQESVNFKKLALIITDEQHRFGVSQRSALVAKASEAPDILVMTATPIPRSLAQTVYAHLGISTLKVLPANRKKIITLLYRSNRNEEIYQGVIRQVAAGRQVYIVCALIDQSENFSVQALTDLYEQLSKNIFKDISCALLHGKLSPQEKELVMQSFVRGDTKILFTTTVIEVGVNVPNANLMVILNAERYGLAQLHQLRGRVGRSSHQSYCALISDTDSEDSLQRLEIVRSSSDCFELAEFDMKQRGIGELLGVKQHGGSGLFLADIFVDHDILKKAQASCREVLACKEMNRDLEMKLAKQQNNIYINN